MAEEKKPYFYLDGYTLGGEEKKLKNVHAEQINAPEVNTDKVMNLSVVGGKLCVTYNK